MEEELETSELKEQMDEHVEHAQHGHGGHGGGHGDGKEAPKWTRYLSLSTAFVAVFAAIAALLSGGNSNEAILAKSDAMLSMAKAADKWGEYQAARLKSAIATNQADIIADSKPDAASKLTEKAKGYEKKSEGLMEDAKKLEEGVEESNIESEHLMHKHHKFAITVTLLQIAIALSAIAALTKRKEMWFVGLAASGAGVVMFVTGLLA